MLRWPSLLGLTSKEGDVCVGQAPSRSKENTSLLILYSPQSGHTFRIYPMQMNLEVSNQNTAIMAEGLREIVNRKVEVPFNRASVCLQYITYPTAILYLYEGGMRSSLFPRYFWKLEPGDKTPMEAARSAIRSETLSETLVGIPDTRPPAEII